MSAEQIAADLTDRIRRREYKPGAQLPTYDSLAALYNVSTGTIARVMIVLRTRGTVIGVPGRGVFVPDEPSR
jgi:GntR family transcriptional regulator